MKNTYSIICLLVGFLVSTARAADPEIKFLTLPEPGKPAQFEITFGGENGAKFLDGVGVSFDGVELGQGRSSTFDYKKNRYVINPNSKDFSNCIKREFQPSYNCWLQKGNVVTGVVLMPEAVKPNPEFKINIKDDGGHETSIDLLAASPELKKVFASDEWIQFGKEASIENLKAIDRKGKVSVAFKLKGTHPKDRVYASCSPVLKDHELSTFLSINVTCDSAGNCLGSSERDSTETKSYTIACVVQSQYGVHAEAKTEKPVILKKFTAEDAGFRLKKWDLVCDSDLYQVPALVIETTSNIAKISSRGTVDKGLFFRSEEGITGRSSTERMYCNSGTTETKSIVEPFYGFRWESDPLPDHIYLTTEMCNGLTWTTDLMKDKYLAPQFKACVQKKQGQIAIDAENARKREEEYKAGQLKRDQEAEVQRQQNKIREEEWRKEKELRNAKMTVEVKKVVVSLPPARAKGKDTKSGNR